MQPDGMRDGEVAVEFPDRVDAHLVFIGRIRTPYESRHDCPRQGLPDGPLCRIEVDEPWVPALCGIERFSCLEVVYWMHLARRDLVRQSPREDGSNRGTFALRSPVRPNPIAISRVRLVEVDGPALVVRGLDCIDGTPLIDIKPVRTPSLEMASAPRGATVSGEGA